MPLVIEQIKGMSMADKMLVMKYLVDAIEKGIAEAEAIAPPPRCLTPDPALHCDIKCNLFEDASAEWESA